MASDAQDSDSRAGPDPAASVLAFADACVARGDKAPARGELQQFVTFFLREQEFGISIMECREIGRVSTIARVPEAPPSIRGVTNLRGRVLPVLDARKCMGLDAVAPTNKSRFIVIEIRGRLFALLVDRVARIVKLAASDIVAQPAQTGPWCATGIAHIDGSDVAVLNVDCLLQAEPVTQTGTGERENT